MRLVFFTLFFLLGVPGGAAPKYFPAAESVTLIRRDLVPMDVDAIRELASQLAYVADGPPSPSGEDLRRRAMCLTLSLRLFPSEPRARAVQEALIGGNFRAAPGSNFKSMRRKLEKTAGWLAKLPKDTEGWLLGQLIFDGLDGAGSVQAGHQRKGSSDRWKDVLVDVASYENASDDPPVVVVPDPEPDPEPMPEPPPVVVTGDFQVEKISAPILALVSPSPEEEPGRIEPMALTSTLGILDRSDEISRILFKVKPVFRSEDDDSEKPVESIIHPLFQALGRPIPKGYDLEVDTKDHALSYLEKENFAASLAMMIDAAMSGRPLRPRTLFLAKLQPDGSMTQFARDWELLKKLDELPMVPGSRLIVGPGMTEELKTKLVFERSDFFLKYEIIEAATFDAARELFYSDGDPGPGLVKAFEEYQIVREKALEAPNIGTFLIHPVVKKRLAAAAQMAPDHLSLNMLAIRSVKRPVYLTRPMFARELDNLLNGLERISYIEERRNDRAYKEIYRDAKARLEPLPRRLNRDDEPILRECLELLKALNSMGRLRDRVNQIPDHDGNRKQLKRFHSDLANFREKLRNIYQKP